MSSSWYSVRFTFGTCRRAWVHARAAASAQVQRVSPTSQVLGFARTGRAVPRRLPRPAGRPAAATAPHGCARGGSTQHSEGGAGRAGGRGSPWGGWGPQKPLRSKSACRPGVCPYLGVVRRGLHILHLVAGEDVNGDELALGVAVLARLGRRHVHHLCAHSQVQSSEKRVCGAASVSQPQPSCGARKTPSHAGAAPGRLMRPSHGSEHTRKQRPPGPPWASGRAGCTHLARATLDDKVAALANVARLHRERRRRTRIGGVEIQVGLLSHGAKLSGAARRQHCPLSRVCTSDVLR